MGSRVEEAQAASWEQGTEAGAGAVNGWGSRSGVGSEGGAEE